MRFAIFDIETRIDKALVKAVFHRHEDIGEEEAFQKTREQIIARSHSGTDFFPVAFHVPLEIGDAPERDRLAAHVDRRELRRELGDSGHR